jgi:uncharacterized protein YjeT (DUF2065 family)
MMSANSPVVKRWFKRFLVALTTLAVGLIVGILMITPPSAETQSAAVVTENEDSVQRAAERGAGFDLVDHELRFAGGYALVAPAERGAGFDFVDHELRFAGGYTLIAPAERGADFYFVDHELKFAGGYALVAPAERDAGFDFVDHELRFAGGYALVAASK